MDIVPLDDTPRKRCTQCNQWFPATPEFFVTDKRKKRGIGASCRTCRSEWQKAYYSDPEQKAKHTALVNRNYAEHREERKQQHRQWKQENREQNLEWNRAYQRAHLQAAREHQRKWRQSHPEKAAEQSQRFRQRRPGYSSQWMRTDYKRRPEKYRAYNQMRRARRMGAEGHYTPQDIQNQLKRQHHQCHYCQAPFVKQGNKYIYQIDHIVPVSRGGTNWPDNLVLACPTCNMSKGDRLLHEWKKGGRLL